MSGLLRIGGNLWAGDIGGSGRPPGTGLPLGMAKHSTDIIRKLLWTSFGVYSLGLIFDCARLCAHAIERA